MKLLEKLEQIKQKGAYAMTIFFGEGEGADDTDIPLMSRTFRLLLSPVGYLGSMRAMYEGTVEEFLEFDFSQEPIVISNPPKREEYENHGFYCWGSDQSIDIYKESGKLFPF